MEVKTFVTMDDATERINNTVELALLPEYNVPLVNDDSSNAIFSTDNKTELLNPYEIVAKNEITSEQVELCYCPLVRDSSNVIMARSDSTIESAPLHVCDSEQIDSLSAEINSVVGHEYLRLVNEVSYNNITNVNEIEVSSEVPNPYEIVAQNVHNPEQIELAYSNSPSECLEATTDGINSTVEHTLFPLYLNLGNGVSANDYSNANDFNAGLSTAKDIESQNINNSEQLKSFSADEILSRVPEPPVQHEYLSLVNEASSNSNVNDISNVTHIEVSSAYEAVSQDVNTSGQKESGYSPLVNEKHEELFTPEDGSEYDYINEYDDICDVRNSQDLSKKSNYTTSPRNRQLPIIPLDIYEPINPKTNRSSAIINNSVLQQRCGLIIKIALIFMIFIGLLVTAVVVTAIVMNRTGLAQVEEMSTTVGITVEVMNTTVKDNNDEETLDILNARSLLDQPRLLSVIDANAAITGLTVLDSELFVLRGWSTQVDVYDTNNFTLTRNITIPGSKSLRAIVASPRYNCLFISDEKLYIVYRYNLSDNVLSNWSMRGVCYGLSLTSTHNILVTWFFARKIVEYTPNGSLVRDISLASSIVGPWHSVQLSSDQFAVSHGDGGSDYRVCIVNTVGRIIQCYGGSMGSYVGQLSVPANLAVDGYGNVLVADSINNRVVLLSPSLTHLGYITIPGYTMSQPYALHLDQLSRRLYIGESKIPKRVFVLTV